MLHIYSNLTFKSVNVVLSVGVCIVASQCYLCSDPLIRCNSLIKSNSVKSPVNVFIFLYYLYCFKLLLTGVGVAQLCKRP